MSTTLRKNSVFEGAIFSLLEKAESAAQESSKKKGTKGSFKRKSLGQKND